MLDELVVKNLGVLEEARLEPPGGFTVITGETGAGKTLLLGALRLLLGQAADTNLVGPYGDEASVEGRLILSDGNEVGTARRLTRHGRSRAYLNGSIASAAALDEATKGLIEIIGQHDHLALTKTSETRSLIDRQLDTEGRQLLDAYRNQWEEVQELIEHQRKLGGDRRALERERELFEYQAEEINQAGFDGGEDEELETRLSRLRHAGELEEHLGAASSDLEHGRERIGSVLATLRKAARLDPSLEALAEELQSLEGRLSDVAIGITRVAEDLNSDPNELEVSEQRYRLLSDLRRKYGASLQEVLEFGAQAQARADELGRILETADALGDELVTAQRRLDELGELLRGARSEAGARLTTEALRHLVELGFHNPALETVVEPATPAASGADTARLLFASDDRLRPGDLARVASGGELSRLVLALRLSGGGGGASTLVFDEVDAGVGGATALALGRKLKGLAADRQVLCVTHLPQIAAFADVHYVVDRTEARATVRKVENDERRHELARMLAGLPESESGQEAAEELLALAASQ